MSAAVLRAAAPRALLRAFTHSRPTHAGERPWQPVAHLMSKPAETAALRASGRRGTGAAPPYGDVRDAARSAVFSQHLRRPRSQRRRTACTRRRRLVSFHRALDEGEGGVTRARRRAGSLHQHALPTAARRPRSRHVRLDRTVRVARRACSHDAIRFRALGAALSPADDPALNDLLLAWYYRLGRIGGIARAP